MLVITYHPQVLYQTHLKANIKSRVLVKTALSPDTKIPSDGLTSKIFFEMAKYEIEFLDVLNEMNLDQDDLAHISKMLIERLILMVEPKQEFDSKDLAYLNSFILFTEKKLKRKMKIDEILALKLVDFIIQANKLEISQIRFLNLILIRNEGIKSKIQEDENFGTKLQALLIRITGSDQLNEILKLLTLLPIYSDNKTISPNPVWRLRIPCGDLIKLSRAVKCEIFVAFISATGFDHVNIKLPKDFQIAKNILFALTLRKKCPMVQQSTKRVRSFLKLMTRKRVRSPAK